MVITTATPKGVGKAADPDLPVEALTGALMGADVWIELNTQWLLYSTPFERIEAKHKNIRYMCLAGFNEELMIRTIGQVDTLSLRSFMKRVSEKTRNAKMMHIENAAGTNVTFEIEPKHLVSCDCGDATAPGIHMLTGQINVVPRFGSIQGTIVFDGSVEPPFGRAVTEPIKLTIEKSIITKIQGGADAQPDAQHPSFHVCRSECLDQTIRCGHYNGYRQASEKDPKDPYPNAVRIGNEGKEDSH